MQIDDTCLEGDDRQFKDLGAKDSSAVQPIFDERSRPLGSNDGHISAIEGDAGKANPWDTHTPIVEQTSVQTAGRVRVGPVHTDRETHSTQSASGEMVDRPPARTPRSRPSAWSVSSWTWWHGRRRSAASSRA